MALKRIEACKTEADGVKAIITLGLEKFPIPGEPGFPLGGLFTAAQSKDEGGSPLIKSHCCSQGSSCVVFKHETYGKLLLSRMKCIKEIHRAFANDCTANSSQWWLLTSSIWFQSEGGDWLNGFFNLLTWAAFFWLIADLLRSYLKQVREETSGRLMEKVYRQNGTPNKWWLAFAKRKFMNIMMPLWIVLVPVDFTGHKL